MNTTVNDIEDKNVKSFIQQTSCIILAGGKSTRMQTNKALLKIHDIYFIDFLYYILLNSGFKNIYISGNLDNYKCIPDSDNTSGPVGAIFSCLKYLENKPCTNLFFFSVDAPLITINIIFQLIKYFEEHSCVYFENLMLPFITKKDALAKIYYSRDKFNLHAIKDILINLNAKYKQVTADENFIIKGVNTKEEYFNYIKILGEKNDTKFL